MSARELVVLGTASQVPTRYRNHNGYYLRWDGQGFLFDPGEGTQRQMVRYGVTTTQVHHVCVTHFHGDHCLGLAGVIQRISLDEVPHEVAVHFPASGRQYFDRLRRASIFLDRSSLRPNPIDAEGEVAAGKTWRLTTMRLDHSAPSWGYRLEEPDGVRMLPDKLAEHGVTGPAIGKLMRAGELEVDGRRVTLDQVSEAKRGQSFAFVMDTRLCAAAFELAKGVDLLVCESTYLDVDRRMAREHAHMTAKQAARVARDGGARRLVLTHFSQRYPDVRAFLDEASELHGDVHAVRDGDVIAVPKRA